MTAQSIHERVSQHYGDLSPQLKRAASFVAGHPEEVATRSLRWLADKAGLPAPTFSRLARAMQYDSYDALRDVCRGEIKRRKTKISDKALELVGQTSARSAEVPDSFLIRQSAASITSIQSLLETIDGNSLEATARRLSSSRQVALFAGMSARPFLEYFAYMGSIALPHWRVLGRSGSSFAADIAQLGKGDSFVVMSIEPYAEKTVQAAAIAHDKGAHVIAITDGVGSPLEKFANTRFLVSTESPQFFPSHVAALVLLESLMGMVVAETGKTAHERIAAVEQQTYMLGEYWQD